MTKLFLQKANVLSGIHLNTWIYNVCIIKRDESVVFA